MAAHRVFSQFDAERESWSTYISRLNHHFIANDVTNEGKKCSILTVDLRSIHFSVNLQLDA